MKKPKKSKTSSKGNAIARTATGFSKLSNPYSGFGTSKKKTTFTKIAGRLNGGN